MLTKNFMIGFAAQRTKDYSETFDYGSIVNHLGKFITYDQYTQYVTSYGELFTAIKAGANPTVSQVKAGQSAGPKGFVFGNGDAPASFTDYKMDGDHFTTFTYTCGKSISVDGNYIVASYLFTLTNTGDEAFTIKEIGQFNYPGSASDKSALLDRTVLDSPVTIEAGGVGQVTYTIKFPIVA